MTGKSKVRFILNDINKKDWEKGEVGYIDGYCRGGYDKAIKRPNLPSNHNKADIIRGVK